MQVLQGLFILLVNDNNQMLTKKFSYFIVIQENAVSETDLDWVEQYVFFT